jgi:hypothetical protein
MPSTSSRRRACATASSRRGQRDRSGAGSLLSLPPCDAPRIQLFIKYDSC